MKYALYLPLMLAVPLSSTPAIAFEDREEFYFDEEIPVVLTSSRLKQPITEAPTAMTIIDRKKIEQSGVREIAALFQLVPGMIVGFESGNWPVVTYHGMSDQYSRRMQILIDGRAVYLPNVGGPDWSSLPLVIDDIERIEITRGSNAATYGSNSFLGIINIITRHSSESKGQFFSYTSGENKVERLVARHGGTFGDLDYRVTIEDEQSNYYDAPKHFQSSKIATFRADYQINSRDYLMYQAGHTDKTGTDRQAGSIFPNTTKRYFHQLEWSRTHSVDNELKLQFYYSSFKNLNFYRRNTPLGLINVEDNVYIQRYDVEAQYTFSPIKKLRGVIGVSSRKDKLKAPMSFATGSNIEIVTHRLFSTLEFRASPSWLLHFGAMFEAHDSMTKKLSPRMAVNYKIAESGTVRLGVSRAYRAPLAFEREADRKVIVGSQTYYLFAMEPGVSVEAEEGTTIDLGYIVKARGTPYTLDFRLYREKLQQLVTPYGWIPTNSSNIAIGFDNYSNATIRGFESSIEYTTRDFDALLTYSYTDIDHQHFGGTATTYDYADSAPKYKASLLLAKRLDSGLTLSGTYHYIDEFLWLGIGDQVESYDRLDLRIAADIKINGNNASMAVVMQNLFTDDYYDFDQDYNFTQRLYLTFAMEFH